MNNKSTILSIFSIFLLLGCRSDSDQGNSQSIEETQKHPFELFQEKFKEHSLPFVISSSDLKKTDLSDYTPIEDKERNYVLHQYAKDKYDDNYAYELFGIGKVLLQDSIVACFTLLTQKEATSYDVDLVAINMDIYQLETFQHIDSLVFGRHERFMEGENLMIGKLDKQLKITTLGIYTDHIEEETIREEKNYQLTNKGIKHLE